MAGICTTFTLWHESARPDFAMAIYRGHLALAKNSIALNPNIKIHISAETPPTFLLQNEDDHVDSIEDALSYYMGLKAANVPVELHARQACAQPVSLKRNLESTACVDLPHF